MDVHHLVSLRGFRVRREIHPRAYRFSERRGERLPRVRLKGSMPNLLARVREP